MHAMLAFALYFIMKNTGSLQLYCRNYELPLSEKTEF